MKALVEPVGQGLGVSLPAAVIAQGQLRAGTELDVSVRDGDIVLSPRKNKQSRLEELVSQITDDNMHEPVDWGPPVGGEVW